MSAWFPGRRVGPGDGARRWYPPSCPWPVVPLWILVLVCLGLAILRVSISCRRCWPWKSFWRLAPFVGHPKNGGAKVRRRFHKWERGTDVMRGRIENWALLSWHWSVNSANNGEFGHSQLRAHFSHSSFSAETLTKHLQLYLLCPGGSRFENSIGRAFGPSRSI